MNEYFIFKFYSDMLLTFKWALKFILKLREYTSMILFHLINAQQKILIDVASEGLIWFM